MNEKEIKEEIERIKAHIKSTDSFYKKRDMRLYLKILRRQLKGFKSNDD